MKRSKSKLGVVGALFLCLGFVLAFSHAAYSQDAQVVATASSGSVAVILVELRDDVASGTGFLVGNGLVLTAYHVIEGGRRVIVKFPKHSAVEAQVLATDRANDLAILGIAAIPIRPLHLGNSDGVRVGQNVVAIGFPRVAALGAETSTVTQGIVSAIRPGQFQMQVPVSPGNSGGPLLTLGGQVIGVVEATLRGEQQGINFATPINAARALLASGARIPSGSSTSHSAPTSTPSSTVPPPSAITPPPSGWKTFTHPQIGYSLSYPLGWNVDAGATPAETVIRGVSPIAASGPTLTLTIAATGPPGRSLELAASRAMDTLSERGHRFTKTERIVVGEVSAFLLHSTLTGRGDEFYVLTTVLIVQNQGYVIGGMAPTSDTVLQDDLGLLLQMIQSFRPPRR